ncbi:MAG TPA: NAD(+) synthase, partial [Longimicrobiales bacterium]|nr:NAD(+) synthase [Longimicrobiales bacterium]
MNQDPGQAPLRVALVQFKPKKADPRANLERVRQIVAEESGHSDVVVFPEGALSGYFLEGGVAEASLSVEQVIEWLGAPPVDAADLVVGFYERWRRRLYNSVVYLEPNGDGWRARHVHRKMFLPTYGVFDEARFVEPGAQVRAFDTRFGRFGMLICEEAWHSLPATILALDGAELIVIVSASPARDFTPAGGGLPANLDRWNRIAPATATEHGVFVVVAQLAGSEGGKLFPGGSIAVAPDGRTLAHGPLLEEGVTIATLDAAALDRARDASPLLSDLEQVLPKLQRSLDRVARRPVEGREGEGEPEEEGLEPIDIAPVLAGRGEALARDAALGDPAALELDLDLVERTLIEFIREEVRRRRGFQRVVIGVSGGVDSAVSLFLACRALGREQVHGFRLPYRTSSEESLEHAALALEATGAHAHTIDITGPIDRYVEEYEPDISPLRRGNLMARLRAVILFDQSAKLEGLPLGTGNKSERL